MNRHVHTLSIFKKPKQAISGNYDSAVVNDTTLACFEVFNYKHSWAWQGGCDSATCELQVTPQEAMTIFESFLGNRVQAHVDNPLSPIWEGYINRIDLELNGSKMSLSLDNMMNRVSVSYFNSSGSPDNKITTEVTNDDSISVYGSKSGAVDIGVEYYASDNRHHITRDKYLARLAYPEFTIAPSSNATVFTLKLSMKGFYHTIGWDTFEVASAGVYDVGNTVFYYLWYAGLGTSVAGFNSSQTSGNGYGVFFNTDDYQQTWFGNASYNTTFEKRAGQSHLDFIKQHVDAGDGVNDWVFGVTTTDPNLGYRRVYYRQANTDTKYYTTLYGDRRIYSLTGELLSPWDIRPDASISIRDMPTLSLRLNNDISTPYITRVEYDAETGVVTWASKDDVTLTGAYQLGKVNRSEGSPFGHLSRRSYY